MRTWYLPRHALLLELEAGRSGNIDSSMQVLGNMVNSSFPTERQDRQGRTRDGRLLAGGGGGRHPLQGNANLMLV